MYLFLSDSFDDEGCKVFNMDIVLLVYVDSNLVWLKYSNTSKV